MTLPKIVNLDDGRGLLAWLGTRDHEGVAQLRELLGDSHPLVVVPLLPDEPTDLAALAELGAHAARAARIIVLSFES